MGKGRHSLKKNIILVFFSIVFTLFFVEVASSVWLNNFATKQQFATFATFEQILEKESPLLYSRHHYLQYIPNPNYEKGANKHNSRGFRGDEIVVPKPKDTFRVVALGGSTTYTTAVDDYRKSYPSLLQEGLKERGYENVEVVNAGVPAYSSWESLLNLQLRVLDLEPDMIIIYHGINDVHPRLVYPYDSYVGDNSASRVPYEQYVESFWDRSTALRIIRTGLGMRIPYGGIGFRRTFEYVPTNFAEQYYHQDRNNVYPSEIFVEHPVSEMLANNKPIFFERNIKNMIAIAKANDIDVMLATWAWSPLFEEARASSEEYTGAFKEQNAIVLDICEETQVACYDFATEMPQDRVYWFDGRHVSEEGASLKAEMFADFIESEQLIKHE